MNLYIELEIYNREIEAKMLLALEAVKRGYSVLIAHRSEIQKLALQNKIPPGIIHMKDANSNEYQVNILKKLKKKKFFFTAQDEESGILNKRYDSFAKIRFSNFRSFNFLSYFFCWGNRDYNYLKRKTKNAILTGSPRFDLFKLKKPKKNKKKKILIISSFNVTGVRNFADRIFATTGLRDKYNEFAEKFAYNMESIHALKVYHFVKLIRYLSKNFKNYEISLRPHPNDNFQDWTKLINFKSKNIKIENVKDLTLDKSILKSKFVIQNGCTSAIESLLLNIPCISYVPQKWKEDELSEFPNSLGIKAKNHSEVAKIIKKESTEKLLIKKKLLKKRFFFEKSSYAYERQINIFDKINKNFKKFDPSIYFKQKNLLKNTLKEIKYIFLERKKSPIEHKFPKFEKMKIRTIINEISHLSKKNHYSNTKFEIISDRILFLRK